MPKIPKLSQSLQEIFEELITEAEEPIFNETKQNKPQKSTDTALFEIAIIEKNTGKISITKEILNQEKL